MPNGWRLKKITFSKHGSHGSCLFDYRLLWWIVWPFERMSNRVDCMFFCVSFAHLLRYLRHVSDLAWASRQDTVPMQTDVIICRWMLGFVGSSPFSFGNLFCSSCSFSKSSREMTLYFRPSSSFHSCKYLEIFQYAIELGVFNPSSFLENVASVHLLASLDNGPNCP